jgi:hypothetical protein
VAKLCEELIDELYVQLDASMFIDNNPSNEEHNTNSNNE